MLPVTPEKLKIFARFQVSVKMGNTLESGDGWETINMSDDCLHYFKNAPTNAKQHLVCNQYCFNPSCVHDRTGPCPKGSDDIFIPNAYYIDDNGKIVGYNFTTDKDVRIPDTIMI